MAEIATRWIRDGTLARLIEWQRTEAEARRNLLLARLSGLVDGNLPPCNHIWMRLPETWRADQILSLARTRGVSLAAPESFSVNPGQITQAIRLCLGAGRSRAEIDQAASVLAGILEGAPILPYDVP